jgi:pilus assembly protein CpaF
MASFLQRKLNEQAQREAALQGAASQLDDDRFEMDEPSFDEEPSFEEGPSPSHFAVTAPIGSAKSSASDFYDPAEDPDAGNPYSAYTPEPQPEPESAAVSQSHAGEKARAKTHPAPQMHTPTPEPDFDEPDADNHFETPAAPAAPNGSAGKAAANDFALAPSKKRSVPNDGKKRMPSKLMALRKALRAKVLRQPDEADGWQRGEADREFLIVDRLRRIFEQMSKENRGLRLSDEEFEQLSEAILDDVLGFGAIDPLVRDKSYSEIMVNGPEMIYAEHKGKLEETQYVYDDEEHILWTAQRIVRPLQRTLDRKNPMVDGRLPDGSRVHIVSQPSALNGTTITIRKFPEKRLTIEDLINFGSINKDVAEFLEACVVSRLNCVVSGGTGSGKTTLLNVLSAFIPDSERIVTIEDAAELQLSQRHLVRLETAPPIPNGDGKSGALSIRDLVKGSLRMRPDRIVVGECRSGEALDMLQAMNTGHDGSLTTVHSNNPRDCVARLETLCLMAGMDMPLNVIRRQIVSAVDLVIQQARLRDGSRKVVQISEIQGMEGDQVIIQDVFVYRTPGHTGQSYSHEGGGKLEPTGFRPKFVDRFEQYGFKMPARIFGAGGNSFSKNGN